MLLEWRWLAARLAAMREGRARAAHGGKPPRGER